MANTKQTTKPVSSKEIRREWHLVDIKGQILGRAANEIARVLQGKHKTNYMPYLDQGDHVVVINAREVAVSGSKVEDKTYTYYSGYPGGLKEVPFSKLQEQRPEEIVRHAVSGMLPKNKLRDRRMARLHIYAGDKHPHAEYIKK